jgi:hypothetical protein
MKIFTIFLLFSSACAANFNPPVLNFQCEKLSAKINTLIERNGLQHRNILIVDVTEKYDASCLHQKLSNFVTIYNMKFLSQMLPIDYYILVQDTMLSNENVLMKSLIKNLKKSVKIIAIYVLFEDYQGEKSAVKFAKDNSHKIKQFINNKFINVLFVQVYRNHIYYSRFWTDGMYSGVDLGYEFPSNPHRGDYFFKKKLF